MRALRAEGACMRQSIVRCACVNATTVGKFCSVTRFVSQKAFPFAQTNLSMIDWKVQMVMVQLRHFQCAYRNAIRFSIPGGQVVMWWA